MGCTESYCQLPFYSNCWVYVLYVAENNVAEIVVFVLNRIDFSDDNFTKHCTYIDTSAYLLLLWGSGPSRELWKNALCSMALISSRGARTEEMNDNSKAK